MVRIIMMQPPSFMPTEMADFDGLYSLDLNEKDRIALTRKIDDYIDVGSIKQDTFKELTLPISKKNRLLFGNIGNPSALNENNNKIFDIQLLKEDFTYPVQGLQVLGNNENDENQYNAKIFGKLNDWYDPLSQLFLNELELGSQVVDSAWVFDRQLDGYLFQDGATTVLAPLCNYGEWFINHNTVSNANSQVVFNNFRFWYSVLAILRQAFCQVGYELVAPILETDFFRKAWIYVLDANFETANQGDVSNRFFETEIQIINGLVFSSLFATNAAGSQSNGVANMGNPATTDPGGHYFTRPWGSGFPIEDFYGSFYSGGMVGIFSFVGNVRFEPTSAAAAYFPISPNYITLSVSIMKAPKFGISSQDDLLSKSVEIATKEYVDKGSFINGIIKNYAFDIKTPRIKAYQHEVVFILVKLNADMTQLGGGFYENESFLYPDMYLSGSFTNIVDLQVIEEGDTLNFGLMMRKDITALDIFKGVAHIPNLKLETDTIEKKVYLYPEFKFNLFSDGLQDAYFKGNNDDTFEATNIIQVKSLEQVFNNTELKMNVKLKFKNSTDGYIQRQNLDQELHSKEFNFGDEYIKGNNEITNPLFEPLNVGIDANLGFSISEVGIASQSVMMIPFMWESQPTGEFEYPSIGFDYAPRIALAYELAADVSVSPQVSGQDLPSASWYVYQDFTVKSHNLFGQIFQDGVTITPFVGSPYQADLAIVYGNGVNPNVDDFFKLVYSKSINQAYFNVALSFLVMLDLASFSSISFRRKWHLKYLSEAWGEIDIYCRLSKVQDYVIGENIVTPVELVPDNNNFTHCNN